MVRINNKNTGYRNVTGDQWAAWKAEEDYLNGQVNTPHNDLWLIHTKALLEMLEQMPNYPQISLFDTASPEKIFWLGIIQEGNLMFERWMELKKARETHEHWPNWDGEVFPLTGVPVRKSVNIPHYPVPSNYINTPSRLGNFAGKQAIIDTKPQEVVARWDSSKVPELFGYVARNGETVQLNNGEIIKAPRVPKGTLGGFNVSTECYITPFDPYGQATKQSPYGDTWFGTFPKEYWNPETDTYFVPSGVIPKPNCGIGTHQVQSHCEVDYNPIQLPGQTSAVDPNQGQIVIPVINPYDPNANIYQPDYIYTPTGIEEWVPPEQPLFREDALPPVSDTSTLGTGNNTGNVPDLGQTNTTIPPVTTPPTVTPPPVITGDNLTVTAGVDFGKYFTTTNLMLLGGAVLIYYFFIRKTK